MRFPFRAFLACTLLLACASRAEAQDLRRGLFDRFDGDRNGRLSAEERADARDYLQRERGLFRSPAAGEPGGENEDFHGMLGRLRARFDANGDGQLDGQEATKAREMWAELRDRTDQSTGGPGAEPRVASAGGKRSKPSAPRVAGRTSKAPGAGAGRAPASGSRAKQAPKAGSAAAGRSPSRSKAPTARGAAPKSAPRATPQRGSTPSSRAGSGGGPGRGKQGGAKAGGGRKKGGRPAF